MSKPKLKKESKRMSCRKKYKIQKKVREHNRKVRKEDKLNMNKRKKSKDPGIPNLYPFKEQLLKQIQEKKEKDADEKTKRKEQKQKSAARKRKLQDLQRNAEKRAKHFDKRQENESERKKLVEFTKGPIEDSKKTFYKEFKKVVEASDVVIEVLDARDPLGCRCPQLEELIMASGKSKKLVLLLNKVDLIPKDIAEKWLKFLRNEYPAVAFKASVQTQKKKLAQSKVSVNLATEDLLKTSNCVGAGTLLKLLGNYCRNSGVKSAITVGVVGFPNVGKSSVINSLKRSKACNVGATPGVTRNMQMVQLDQHVKLLDCPGIVVAAGSSDTQIILRNAVKVESLDDPVKPVEAILSRCNKSQVMEKYCVADYNDTMEFLSMFAKRLGKLRKGGVPDILASAKIILQDWNNGKITFYTHPPERKTTEHDSATIMQYLGAEFDLKSLEHEEKDDLEGLSAAMGSALVLDPGKPTDMEEVPVEDNVDEHSDNDEDAESEEEKMVDTDNEENIEASIIQMHINKKTNVVAADGMKKTMVLTDDVTNKQINQDKKKSFKNQKKEERKKNARLIAAEETSMKVDDQSSTTDKTSIEDVAAEETLMKGGDRSSTADKTSIEDDDDSYNFDELIPT